MAFGAFAESIGERAEPKDAQEEIYVGLEHLDPQCLHIRRWGKGRDVTGTKLRFRKGDIIFGRRRAYQRKLAVAEFDGICSAHAMVVRARPDKVLPEFLPFLMMSDRFMNRAVEISVGSLSPTINWTTLKLEEFDLPPLDQQRRIAEILWAVDEVLLTWIEVKIKLDQLRTSYAVDAFGVLGTASTHTKLTVPLSDLVELNPSLGIRLSDETEVSFIAMADVSEVGRIIHSEARKYIEVKNGFTVFRDGDILFAKITPCMENGKGALASDLCNGIGFGSTEFHVLRPKLRDDAEFIFHLTMLPVFRRAAKRYMRGSAGQQRVPSDFLRDYRIAIADRSRRKEIGETLASMTQQIEQISIMQTKLGSLTSTLLNGVLGGSQ
jgi:restriction endonuclease S subunit